MVLCKVMAAVVGCGALFASVLGCLGNHQRPVSQPRFLEELFAQLEVSGDRRFWDANYVLKEGVNPEYAAVQIAAYLRNEPGAPESRIVPAAYAQDVAVNRRDFWAMVLAEMTNVEIGIGFGRHPHEDQIQTVLREIAAAPEQHRARSVPGFSALSETLKGRMAEVQPMLARYLGVSEREVVGFSARSASPTTPEAARSAGLKSKYIIRRAPERLAGSHYTWEGVVDFDLRGSSAWHYEAVCFYDPEAGHWLVDQVRKVDVNTEKPTRVEPHPASGF
jgi:hypothetical protein